MSSTFVTRNTIETSKSIFGGMNQEKFFFQFVPGICTHTITSHESAGFESLRDINSIGAIAHISEDGKGVEKKYFPLLRGVVDTPIKGDQVLLCTVGDVDYYLGPINTTNKPNWNIDHLYNGGITRGGMEQSRKTDTKFGTSKNFKVIKSSTRLGKLLNTELDFPEGMDTSNVSITDIHGDMSFEGRHGNSVRLGSRFSSPYLIISNGKPVQSITESAQHDGSILAFTQKGTIHQHFKFDSKIEDEGTDTEREVDFPFVLGSDTVENAKRLIGNENYDYSYNKNQIFFNSGRITINSKSDDITLSSFKNFFIGSGNDTKIITNGSTTIESSNIYLGQQAKNKFDNNEEVEPLVLGKQLNIIMKELLDILKDFKVSGVIGGVSGTSSPDIASRLENLSNKLDNPNFLSEYHFIEDNNQKI